MDQDVRGTLRAFYDQEMPARAARPVADERRRRLVGLLADLRERGATSVLEVGCGAGRDGTVLHGAGFAYTGVDLSASAVLACSALGLHTVQADAVSLPFGADSFDAAWTMSTLMHLPGDDFQRALRELRRVVRAGGLVEVGVWGHTENREWTSDGGRFFRHRSDETFTAELEQLGRVVDFATWGWLEDSAHYQWARVEVSAP